MEQPSKFGNFLRFIGIVMRGLTAVLILLGWIGTTCVALGAEKYESFSSLAHSTDNSRVAADPGWDRACRGFLTGDQITVPVHLQPTRKFREDVVNPSL